LTRSREPWYSAAGSIKQAPSENCGPMEGRFCLFSEGIGFICTSLVYGTVISPSVDFQRSRLIRRSSVGGLRVFFGPFLTVHLAPYSDMDGYLGFTVPEPHANLLRSVKPKIGGHPIRPV